MGMTWFRQGVLGNSGVSWVTGVTGYTLEVPKTL